MKTIKFYDTSSLLLKADSLFEVPEEFAISSITLEELENIKTSAHKDADIKYAARKLINLLNQHIDEYKVVLYEEGMLQPVMVPGNDAKILACAYSLKDADTQIEFVTNDLCLKHLARECLNKVSSIENNFDEYSGFKDIMMNEKEMEEFYLNLNNNPYNLLINEYLIVRNTNNEIVDRLCWTGENYRHLSYGTFSSKWFGNVKPIKGDIYQSFVADSFINNKITLVKGPAGSGKSYLSLGFLISELEKYHLDKIIIFCNTVATADSAKLGYYPGSRLEKLLDSQIGNFLIGKFGGLDGVQQLINDNKLELLPLSDIRGFDTGDLKIGIYITEAQNLSNSLMKLALQRIGENCICIIDGDNKQQVDLKAYEGGNNGMRNLSKAFRGEDLYGEITLQKIYRSRIAEIAERI